MNDLRAHDFVNMGLARHAGMIADLAWLRRRGMDEAIAAHAAAGRPVLGICGGFQMLGATVDDPHGVEAPAGTSVAGLALLDARTAFAVEKTVRLSTGVALGATVCGYEIHHGVVTGRGEEFAGGVRRGRVFGTMWHGTLESDGFRTALLDEVGSAAGRVRTPPGIGFARAKAAPGPPRRPHRTARRRRRGATAHRRRTTTGASSADTGRSPRRDGLLMHRQDCGRPLTGAVRAVQPNPRLPAVTDDRMVENVRAPDC